VARPSSASRRNHVRAGELEWQVKVKGFAERRAGREARKLYEENEASRVRRERRTDLSAGCRAGGDSEGPADKARAAV